ncbi:MAG: MATE family efflux transporter [Lachnospiraceae bacterium]|nr:MATE family efflux transporter [Lachnospiraceae bacterium]
MKDMTKGSPVKLIIGFAIPMLIGNIFQQVYNVVDTVIVGRYLGEDALAGVGSTGTLTFFLLALVYGMCNGAGLVVAQCFGMKDREKMKKSVVALVWVAGVLTVVISILGICASRFFLHLLSVPENVIEYSVQYLRIIYAFALGSVIYNGASAILRSTGDSKTPLYALIAASILNVCLDLLFVLAFHLGVRGVAYATICSQCLSAVITVGYIIKKRAVIGLTDLKWRVDRKTVFLIIKTGFPAAFQSCMIALGGMSVQRLVNSYGSSVMAAYVAANKVDSVAIQVIVSIGTALSVFTGQNMGQCNYKRIHEGLKKTLSIMVGASIFIAVCVLIFRNELMSVFLDASESMQSIQIGATYLSIIGIAYVIAGIMQSYQNVIRGAGDVNTCMVAGLTELGGRIVFAYLLSSLIGVTGIWIATPLSWGCGCIIPVIRYYSGKWKFKKLV